MPNTLAHIGLQGFMTRAVLRRSDLKWIYMGFLIPDLPWMAQRVLLVLIPNLDRYDLRLYAIVQSSLAFCIILSAALALVSRAPRHIFLMLSVNCALHLGLDALQTKWANGVHFWAPFSWRLTNLGWFWPEEWPTHVITAMGLVFVLVTWRNRDDHSVGLFTPHGSRITMAAGLAFVYFLAPFVLLPGPFDADNHSVKTLSQTDSRVGKYAEFDRNLYIPGAGRSVLRTFAGEDLALEGYTQEALGNISLRARFVEPATIQALEVHRHSAGYRDLASYLGLAVIGLVWLEWIVRRILGRRTRSTSP